MYGVMHPFSKAIYEVDETGAVLITTDRRPGRPLPARRLLARRRGVRRRSPAVQLGRRRARPAPPAERTEGELTMTAHPHTFRFGAKAVKAGSAKEWTDIVRQVEDLGYVSFHMDDHFGNQLAVVPALMAAADATSSILVGPHVAGVDFRNPVHVRQGVRDDRPAERGPVHARDRRRVVGEGLRHRRHPPGRRAHAHRPPRRGGRR